MSARAALLRIALTYERLRAQAEAQLLEAQARADSPQASAHAEVLDALAAVSVLAVLADVESPQALARAPTLDVSTRISALSALIALGDFLWSMYPEELLAVADVGAQLQLRKGFFESAHAADGLRRLVGKSLADTPTTAEALFFAQVRQLADSVRTRDALGTLFGSMPNGAAVESARVLDLPGLSTSKDFDASVAAADALDLAFLKSPDEAVAAAESLLWVWSAWRAFDEGATVADAAALTTGFARQDALTAADRAALEIQPQVADPAAAGDAVWWVWEALRDFSDTATSAEALELHAGMAAQETPVLASEAAALALEMQATDRALAGDLLSSSDSPELWIWSSLGDYAHVGDAATRLLAVDKSEAVGAHDSGSVWATNYATDYFAEIYAISQMSTF